MYQGFSKNGTLFKGGHYLRKYSKKFENILKAIHHMISSISNNQCQILNFFNWFKDCFNKKYAKTVSQFSKPHVVFIFSNFQQQEVYKLRQFKKKFTVWDFFGGCGASHI